MAVWSVLGVESYITEHIAAVSLDTTPCESIQTPWAGCVTLDDATVHAKDLDRWYVAPWWTWLMLHEAAHMEQVGAGWDFSRTDTEADADRRALHALMRGLMGAQTPAPITYLSKVL